MTHSNIWPRTSNAVAYLGFQKEDQIFALLATCSRRPNQVFQFFPMAKGASNGKCATVGRMLTGTTTEKVTDTHEHDLGSDEH